MKPFLCMFKHRWLTLYNYRVCRRCLRREKAYSFYGDIKWVNADMDMATLFYRGYVSV